MEFISLSILFVFFLSAGVFSFWPLFSISVNSLHTNEVSEKDKRISRLMTERENLYKNILEVRFDKAMKKLSNEDYAKLLTPLNEKALNVLRRLEALGVREGDAIFEENRVNEVPKNEKNIRDKIEEEILRYRTSSLISDEKNISYQDISNKEEVLSVDTFFCTSCGHSCRAEDKFCSYCGNKIK